jgi:hypothetical protein
MEEAAVDSVVDQQLQRALSPVLEAEYLLLEAAPIRIARIRIASSKRRSSMLTTVQSLVAWSLDSTNLLHFQVHRI